MQETWRAQFGAVRFVGAVCHQIDAKFALWCFDGAIHFTFRHVEPFGVKLEVVDQRFHRGLHLRPLWRRHLTAGKDIALPLGRAQLFYGLFDDFQGLAHLFHANEIAVIAIAVLANRDFEVELVVTLVWLRPAQVPSEARAAHHDTGKAPIEDVVFINHTNVSITLFEYTVFGQQPVNVGNHGWEFVSPDVDIVDQIAGQVLMHTTGSEVRRVQTRAAGPFVKHHELFALFKAPQRWGQRPHIHRLRRDVQKVVQDATDLGIKHPDQRRAAWYLNTGQLFARLTPRMLLVHRRNVIKPVEIRQVLQIRPAFHQLLGATVQQADMRITTLYNLAVQF